MNPIAAVLGPAVVAGVVWFLAGRMWRRKGDTVATTWASPLALGIGYIVTHAILLGLPAFPPLRATDTLFYVVPVAAIAAMAQSWWGRKSPIRWLLLFAIFAAAFWLQFRRVAENAWTTVETIYTMAGMIAVAALVCLATGRASSTREGAETSFQWWFVAVCASGVLVCSSSVVLGQLAGGIAGVLGAAWVLAMWRGKLPLHTGGDALFTLILAGLIAQGYHLADTPLYVALLIVLALPFGVFAERFMPDDVTRLKGLSMRMGAVAVPALIALGIALFRYFSQSTGDYYY